LQEQIRNYDQQNTDESCQIEQVEVHSLSPPPSRGGLNLAFLHFITTTAMSSSAPCRLGQHQILIRYRSVGPSGQSAHETISCSESQSVFCDVIVCVLIEGAHRFWTGICLSDTLQEIMIKVGTPIS
jgi:hypothetical protein